MTVTTTCFLQEKLKKSLMSLNHIYGYGDIFSKSFSNVAVAYSGGLDSSVLLHLMNFFARQYQIQLYAFHINHGININANDWQSHCQKICQKFDIKFKIRNVLLAHHKKTNIEETARIARYHALGQLCREQKINLLLTGHHLNDQAETVLLQLLRGCGVLGISGMGIANVSPNLLGNCEPQVLMGRPLLSITRDILKQYAIKHAIVYVEDDSNNNMCYARNILRHRIMPILSNYFPGFQVRLARTAIHAQSAQHLLKKTAQQNFVTCRIGEDLNLLALRKLDSEELDNLLRYWLGLRGVRMPSTAWLFELRKQLITTKNNTQIYMTYLNYSIQTYDNRIILMSRHIKLNKKIKNYFFIWRGEETIYFSQFSGSLSFNITKTGLDPVWLRQQLLCIRLRQGGEHLQLAYNRPIKSLKYHYQAMNIPMQKRMFLPLIYSGDQILYAAGLGMDFRRTQCINNTTNSNEFHKITLNWQHR